MTKSSSKNPFQDDEFLEISSKVFDLELLREIILEHAISEKNYIQIHNVTTCRLVCRAWLSSVSRILLKRGEPLFRLRMPSVFMAKPITSTALHQFLYLQSLSGIDERIPPHAISSSCDHFHEDNYATFLECFVSCGSSLVELELECSEAPFPKSLNNRFSFPKLQKFHVILNRVKGETVYKMEDKIDFIQSVFHSSKQLKSFTFSWPFRTPAAPESFGTLIFPPSITQLDLNCLLNSSSLEALVKNPLPNLKMLKLCISGTPFRDGLISSILENVRKTLESFHATEVCLMERIVGHPTTFRLPLMEKLKRLEIESAYLQLEDDSSSLERLVPQLKHMSLSNQTVSSFRKWADRSWFRSVTSLQVSLVSLERSYVSRCDGVNFDLASMSILKGAYPNLRKLSIDTFDAETSPILFIMKEMTNLQHLRIASYITHAGQVIHSEFWNALLLGIPLESVARLKESPENWKELKSGSTPSIWNMTNLQTLELACFFGIKRFEISSEAFNFGLLEMPQLKKFSLIGKLSVKREMIDEWRKQGRAIGIRYISDSGDECNDITDEMAEA